MNWEIVVGIVAVVSLVVSFFQWHVNQNYKRINERFNEWSTKVETLCREVDEVKKLSEATKDKLLAEYIDHDKATELKHELHDGQKELKGELDKIFRLIRGISREVSEVIGEMRMLKQVIENRNGRA